MFFMNHMQYNELLCCSPIIMHDWLFSFGFVDNKIPENGADILNSDTKDSGQLLQPHGR